MTIIETVQDVLNHSLFPNDERSPNHYFIEQNEQLRHRPCVKWGHIGLFPNAWGSENHMIIDWYGYHLVFETESHLSTH